MKQTGTWFIWSVLLLSSFIWSAETTLQVDYSYLRKLAGLDNGTSHLFLKNTGDRPALITEVFLDDEPLPRQDILGVGSQPEILPGLKLQFAESQEDFRIVWYQITPNPVPPGKVADVAVKWAFAPTRIIKIGVTTAKGNSVSDNHPPRTVPLRLTAIRFSGSGSKVFFYVINEGERSIHAQQVFLDSNDVTPEVFPAWPWVALQPAEKRCFVFMPNKPLRQGDYVTVKVTSAEEHIAESTVRVFAGFPIPYYGGNYCAELSDGDSQVLQTSLEYAGERDFIYAMGCPTHAHGTYSEAGSKLVGAMNRHRSDHPGTPAFVHICKAVQEEGAYLFSEIADFTVHNLYEPYSEELQDPLVHPTQRLARIAKQAVSPRPMFMNIRNYPDERFDEFKERTVLPEEIRLFVYCGLSCGAAGLFLEMDAPYDENKMSQLIGELRAVRNYLSISEPIPGATANHPQVEAALLQAGYDALVLLLINHDHLSRPAVASEEPFEYRAKQDIEVTVNIPQGFSFPFEVNEIEREFKTRVIESVQENRRIRFSVPRIDLTKLYLLEPDRETEAQDWKEKE